MPILSQHDVIEFFGETIDHRHHGIAIGNRQRAAGAQIILHVDDQQHIVIAYLHFGPCKVLVLTP